VAIYVKVPGPRRYQVPGGVPGPFCTIGGKDTAPICSIHSED
jgi:hypothetical protein